MKLFEMTVLPLGALRKAPWNYKSDDAEMAAKLRGNMERNGQLENIVVREIEGNTFEVVNGNHRYDAMEALKWTHATCLNLGPISESAAKRIAIELNETKFSSDPQSLSEIMVGLQDEFGKNDILGTMPFSQSDLEMMTDPTLFLPPPDPPNTPDSASSGPQGSGGAHPKLDTPFTFTLRFHEKNLIEWLSLLKMLREAYAVDRNEDALLSLVRSYVPTAVEVDGFQKVVGLLPPQIMGLLKQVEAHISESLEEDDRSLIDDPHLRLGQIIEILTAEYIASYGL